MTGSDRPTSVSAYGRTVRVADIPFIATTLEDAVSSVLDSLGKSEVLSLRFANAYCVSEATRDGAYRSLLSSQGINFPDGTPVGWYMRRSLRGQGHADAAMDCGPVRGPSFFELMLDRGREQKVRHFLLGATPETLVLLQESIATKFPGAIIAGVFAPPFGTLDDSFYRGSEEAIANCQPDIVWVALGAPKQDFASAELTRRLEVSTAGVGAAFDFLAGTVTEAPEWIRNTGFEWVHRLASEPRRLWKRYLFGNARFIFRSEISLWNQKRISR